MKKINDNQKIQIENAIFFNNKFERLFIIE